jgi:hypothetical protein
MKSRLVILFLAGLVVLVLFTASPYKAEGRSPEETKRLPVAPQISDINPVADSISIENQSENYATRWYYTHNLDEIKGVALVIHGLNLRPDKMQPIISVLTESGIDVLGLSLRGHGENYTHHAGIKEDQARLEAFKAVSFPLWIKELKKRSIP